MCETYHFFLYKVPCWQIDDYRHLDQQLPLRARAAGRDGHNQSLMLFLQNSICSKKSSVRCCVGCPAPISRYLFILLNIPILPSIQSALLANRWSSTFRSTITAPCSRSRKRRAQPISDAFLTEFYLFKKEQRALPRGVSSSYFKIFIYIVEYSDTSI